MNHTFIAILLLLAMSCSKQSTMENLEDFKIARVQGPGNGPQEIFELDLHQYALLKHLSGQYGLKRELEQQIEQGNEEQISSWESLMEQINRSQEILELALENSCSYLRMREEVLQIQVLVGDEQAEVELEEIREKLEKCPIELDAELPWALEAELIILAIEKGTPPGGRCSPGEEWSCLHDFEEGILLINIVESQGQEPEVFLKDMNGEVIAQAEMLGEHSEIEGVVQIALELSPIENGMLEIIGEDESYELMISVH